MMIFNSRYTSGLRNGENVLFNIGETVHYRTRNGNEFDIVIQSDLRLHTPTGYMGYEAIFPDGALCFAVSEGIVGWDGKC